MSLLAFTRFRAKLVKSIVFFCCWCNYSQGFLSTGARSNGPAPVEKILGICSYRLRSILKILISKVKKISISALESRPQEKSQGFPPPVEVHFTLHRWGKSLGIFHLVPEQKRYRFRATEKYAQAKAARELQMKYLQVYPELKQVCLNKAIEQILSGCWHFLDRASNPWRS